MKKFILFAPVTLLLLHLVSFNALGQEFSSEWETIPLTFKGNDFPLIYSNLSKSPLLKSNFQAKDEFETTAEYVKRTNVLSRISLGNNLTGESQITFVYFPEKEITRYKDGTEEFDFADVKAKYDADNGTLNISLIYGPLNKLNFLSGSGDFSGYRVPVKPKEYETDGKRSISRNYILSIDNLSDFSFYGSEPFTTSAIALKLPPSKAREAKENLAFLYVVKLSKPFLDFDAITAQPTKSNPKKIEILYFSLMTSASEIWIFNRATGEIYTKIKSKVSR